MRAPWWVVPFLSLAYWWASWAWLGLAGPGRLSFLQASLALFAGLLLLRLARLEGASRPAGPTLLVALAAAAASLVPARLAFTGDADLSFAALVTRLLVWRDGIPATFAPLLAPLPFRTHSPGLSFLAADAALLSGGELRRLTLLGAGVGPGLLALCAFAGLRRWLRPGRASALAALGALTSALTSPWASPTLVQALAFCVAAGALLAWPMSNARAVSVGALLGTAVLADLRGFVLIGLLLAGSALRLEPPSQGSAGRRLRVGGLALAAAVFSAGPACWRLAPVPFLGRAFPSVRAGVTSDDLGAMAWLADHGEPLDLVCIEPGGAGIWIPGLAGRPVNAPHLPVYLESAGRAPARPCAIEYGHGLPRCPAPVYLQHDVFLCGS